MNTAQKEYVETVARYLEGVAGVSPGACPGCASCGLEDVADTEDERYQLADGGSFFSSASCECCGSILGGDRHYAHGLIGDEVVHFDICADCLFYLASGDLPELETI